MIRALIVDDHAVVRQGLNQILVDESDIEVGGEAATAREAIRMGKEQDWDIVVLDLTIPEGSGLDVLKELKHAKPELPVIVLSVHDDDQYVIRTLRAGASGYLTKECAPEELVRAIRHTVDGGKYLSQDLAATLVGELTGEGHRQNHHQLSDREFQTLCLLASGMSTGDIAEELSVSPKTISTYRRRVLDKLELETTADLIRYALQHNLVE